MFFTMKYNNFGKLTLKQKKLNDFSFINKKSIELDWLFEDSMDKLNDFSVIEAERRMALENLRDLTKRLQNKRLQEKMKDKLRYFSA